MYVRATNRNIEIQNNVKKPYVLHRIAHPVDPDVSSADFDHLRGKATHPKFVGAGGHIIGIKVTSAGGERYRGSQFPR